ncbi:MAG: penicillin-binding transpeptidase domain-containing protein [Micromonosporaceae bacterium]
MGRRVVALVAALATVSTIAGCSSEPGPEQALREFLRHWSAGSLAKLTYADSSGKDADRSGKEIAEAYRRGVGELADRKVRLKAGKVTEDGDKATGSVEVSWSVADGVAWRYRAAVPLRYGEHGWRVAWSSMVVHPELGPGERFTVDTTAPARGDVTDHDGTPIVTRRQVVYVGVHPKWVEDADKLAADLGRILAIDTADLPARIAKADPGAFVEVVTLRRPDYDKVKAKLRPLAGTVFRDGELPLAPTRGFARALLGTAGPVTKEIMDAAPGRYRVGDTVGLSGLQKRYDTQLFGSPGVAVRTTQQSGAGEPSAPLYEAEPKPGKPLRLTLDQRVQAAAEAALGAEKRKAALVAVRVSDGAVLAVGNGPGGQAENLAFDATVPPGSTFKVVSTLALLGKGVTAEQTVPCPKYATVEGRRFSNDHDFELGDISFRTAFAKSCNTTFVSLAPQLGEAGLTEAGTALGLGAEWQLGVAAHPGNVPGTPQPVDRAASAFGQGKVTVSPLAMAGVAAAVAKGRWQQPTLLLNPAQKPASPGPELDPKHVTTLHALMRAVVTEGTATSLADAPGGPVYGKTGTAEYGTETPPRSHSWFIGWQGDVAFAVLVLDGGSSSDAAVPLTGRFLTHLRR